MRFKDFMGEMNTYFKDFMSKMNTYKEKMIILIKNTEDLKTKHLVLLVAITAVVFLVYGKVSAFSEVDKVKYNSLKEDAAKISFAGDVSPSRFLKDVSKKYGHDIFYQDVKEIWKDSDITLINLEAAVLANDPEKFEYSKINKDTEIHLDISENDIKAIKDSGINLVGLANNHAKDFLTPGMVETLGILKANKLKYIGAGEDISRAMKPYRKTLGGKKVAIMAMSGISVSGAAAKSNIPGVFNTEHPHRDDEIENMVRNNDISIVYIHWGTEYSLKPSSYTKKFGKKLIDMGVDIVIGSHPHVLLPVEKYNDGIIIYSLGNLVFDQKAGRSTDSIIANLYIDGDERFFEFVPLSIKNGIPYKTDNKVVTNRIFKELKKGLDKNSYKVEDKKLIVNF